MYMMQYIRKVMFLEGHVDYWHFLMNFGNVSIFQFHKEAAYTITKICLEQLMFIMSSSIYLEMNWPFYKVWESFKLIIHPDTLEKISVTRDKTHPRLLEIMHPC